MKKSPDQNSLFPVFLKPGSVRVLLVGGGTVAAEKLYFLLKSSPGINIKLVSPLISEEIEKIAANNRNISIVYREFHKNDLDDVQVAIVAIHNNELNQKIREYSKIKNILVNFADQPALCDFYLGSIVTRGDLKIAISTNGKSPVFAKRFRQFLEEMIPENIQLTLENLHLIRQKIIGDFNRKLQVLNKITSNLVKSNDVNLH